MLDRVLGSGVYGSVYLSKEVATSRQVACKVVDLPSAIKKLATSENSWSEGAKQAKNMRKKVLQEIGILSKISHVRSGNFFLEVYLTLIAEHYRTQDCLLL